MWRDRLQVLWEFATFSILKRWITFAASGDDCTSGALGAGGATSEIPLLLQTAGGGTVFGAGAFLQSRIFSIKRYFISEHFVGTAK
jgi:hypothetical protein